MVSALEPCKFIFWINLANSFFGFRRISKRDSLLRIGGHDATEAAADDGIGRPVPGPVGSDHQYETRAGAACRQARLGLDRRRDCAALQRARASWDRDAVCDRAIAAQAHLRPVRRRRLRSPYE